jgi:hypothetical protein
VSSTPGQVDTDMLVLTVAAYGAITDYSDVMVRGALKEHPALVLHQLDLLAGMIATVRRQAVAEEIAWRREEVANGWPPPDPAGEHAAEVAVFTQHKGCCEWCLVCLGHPEDSGGDGDYPEV